MHFLFLLVLLLCTPHPHLPSMGVGAQIYSSDDLLSLTESPSTYSAAASDSDNRDISQHYHHSAWESISQSYEALAGLPINCSRTLSPSVRNIMRSIAFGKGNGSTIKQHQNRTSLRIPDEYLHNCLRAYPYNLEQLPLGFTKHKLDIGFNWRDHYRMWMRNASDLGVGNWSFGPMVWVPSGEVWHPVFELAQCEQPPCYIQPDNLTYVLLTSNGTATYQKEFYLKASCDVNMEAFPFDRQTCKLAFLLSRDDFLQNVRIKSGNDVFLRTKEEAEEWDLIEISHGVHSHSLKHYDYNGTIWLRTNKTLKYRIPAFRAQLVLKRHSQYYVFILIIPVVVMTFCNIFSVVLPSDSDAKLEFLATVLNGFIFIQTILANLLPKVETLPLIANYVVLSLGLCLFNTVGCMFVVSAGSFGEQSSKPPRILSLIFIESVCTIVRVFWWLLSKLCPCWHYAQVKKAQQFKVKGSNPSNINKNHSYINQNNGLFRGHNCSQQLGETETASMPMPLTTNEPQVVAFRDTLFTTPRENNGTYVSLNTPRGRQCAKDSISPSRSTQNLLRNNNNNNNNNLASSRTSIDPFSQTRLERLPPRNQRMTASDHTLHNYGVPNQLSLFEFTDRPIENDENATPAGNMPPNADSETVPLSGGHCTSSFNSPPNGHLSLSTSRTPNDDFSVSPQRAENRAREQRQRQLENEDAEEMEQKEAKAKRENAVNSTAEEGDPHAAHVSWPVLARNLNVFVSLCYVAGNLYAFSYIAPLMHAWHTDPEDCWLSNGCR